MSIKIYFDMDGTVYDFYSQTNWLDRLINEDVSVYKEGGLLFNIVEFNNVVRNLISRGVEFGVITWASKGSSDEFFRETETAKRQWCKEYLPFCTSFVVQEYGTPKQYGISKRTKKDILIDDNIEVLKMWDNFGTRRGFQITKYKDVTRILRDIELKLILNQEI